MRKIIEHTILLLFLIPLFFINIKSSHDWGDDFAQYIHQAKNISEGISQNETGYIYNPDIAVLGPQAYPIGLPMILASFIESDHIDFVVLNYVMTFFLVMASVFAFLFFRNNFSFLTSLFTTIIIAYNPYFLNFKSEINSDIPFTAFLFFSLFLISRQKTIYNIIILGTSMAFLAHIRSIGLLFFLVYILYLFIFDIEPKLKTSHLKKQLLIFSFLIPYFGLKFYFPCSTNYPFLLEGNHLFERINEHLSYNFLALSYFFNIYEPINQYFIGVISSSVLVVTSLLGFLYQWKTNKINFINFFVLAYIITIATFPFGNTGLRFISPILFLVFYYSIIALKKILMPFQLNYTIATPIFGVIILMSYKPQIEKLIENQNTIINGPCTNASNDAFRFIKSMSSNKDVIVFEKPRALALYTHTKAVALKNDLNAIELKKQLKKFNATYLLMNTFLPNDGLSNYLKADSLNHTLLFSNSEYQFYRLL